MKKSIWLIGVNPPCPRCDIIRQRIEYLLLDMGKDIEFKRLAYTDREACDFAASIGREPGTARLVAQRAGIRVDWNRLDVLSANPSGAPEDIERLTGPATRWSPEFDDILKACQDRAESVGILMTPVLLVDGKVVHSGSVPSLARLKAWLA